jgi:hypothetical protein
LTRLWAGNSTDIDNEAGFAARFFLFLVLTTATTTAKFNTTKRKRKVYKMLKHRIQTTFNHLDDLITATGYNIAGHDVSYSFDRKACVVVKGNGAILRDVVDTLDRAGFLD